MRTIKVAVDQRLLQSIDRAARRSKKNRSALIRDALSEHLQRLEILALEERDRQGYARIPDDGEGIRWEAEAALFPEIRERWRAH